jgi:hypothetical protein
MEVLGRVRDNPNICRVELAFEGSIVPANIPLWQPFYNSALIDAQFHKTAIGLGSVAFAEESQESPAGISYKQSVSIRFPTTDEKRSERIALMMKARYVKVHLSTGRNFVIGRNDYTQNARPKIKVKTNQKTAEVEFETVSIFPTGYMAGDSGHNFLGLIPILLD